ncbi:MAG: ATP-binding protein [Syntrophaceae bacterium]|nr:ATP-binding protein [Syntrophaceae bacterium]
MTAYVERDIGPAVLAALKQMPVVVLSGMRQTGKTTFLQRQPGLEGRRYVTFDDFGQLAAAKSDPDGFIEGSDALTIDEAHKCPEIMDAIKRSVDRQRQPGRFLLSGSANFLVLKALSESLAGRALYFVLHPFTRRELGGAVRSEPFIKRFFADPAVPRGPVSAAVKPEEVCIGGLPAVCLREVTPPSMWFRGYEQTYLERDVRDLSRISDMIAFRNLLRLVALRTGGLLSPSGLGRDAKLNAKTTARYLSLLEASFVVHRLPPFLRSRASRLIKSPKLYVSDSGLAAWLAGVDPDVEPQGDPLYGALFETFAAQNLSGILDSRWQEARLHFLAVQGRYEVDFVIEAGRHCMALEVKSGARWDERDLSGLKAFLSSTPQCRAGILCHNGKDAVRLGERLWALPLGLILS